MSRKKQKQKICQQKIKNTTNQTDIDRIQEQLNILKPIKRQFAQRIEKEQPSSSRQNSNQVQQVIRKKRNQDGKISSFSHQSQRNSTKKVSTFILQCSVSHRKEIDQKVQEKYLCYQKNKLKQYIDRKIFDYDDIQAKFRAMIPSKLIEQVVQSHITKNYKLYGQILSHFAEMQPPYQYMEQIIKNKLIIALKRGNIQFAFNMKDQNAKKSYQTHKFQVRQRDLTILSQQKYQKQQQKITFQLMQSLEKSIKVMIREKLPHKVLLIQKSDDPSVRQIQIVAIENEINQKNGLVSVWLLDFIGQQKIIKEKVIQNVQRFLNVKDKNIIKVYMKQIKMEINYLIFSNFYSIKEVYQKDISKLLQQKFEKQIKISQLNYRSNVLTIEQLKDQPQCFLKRIGFIPADLGLIVQILDESQKNN